MDHPEFKIELTFDSGYHVLVKPCRDPSISVIDFLLMKPAWEWICEKITPTYSRYKVDDVDRFRASITASIERYLLVLIEVDAVYYDSLGSLWRCAPDFEEEVKHIERNTGSVPTFEVRF